MIYCDMMHGNIIIDVRTQLETSLGNNPDLDWSGLFCLKLYWMVDNVIIASQNNIKYL